MPEPSETPPSAHALALRAWRHVISMVLSVGVILFVAAGTLRYWQAWMYVGIYALALCFNTAYFLRSDPALVERRLHAGPGAEHSSRQRRIQAITACCLLSMLVIAGLDHRRSLSSLPAGASMAAALVFVAALVVVFMVFTQNSHAGSVVEVTPGQLLATRGLYGCVRHPMYAASAMAFIATPVMLGSVWALTGAMAATLAMAARLRDEERELIEHLPGYVAYCRAVRFRLIPGIW